MAYLKPLVTGLAIALLALATAARAAIEPGGAALYLDFRRPTEGLRLVHGARVAEDALEFTGALQYAEVAWAHKLDGIAALSVGGWFFPRRGGEQSFASRGLPQVGSQGERFFRPQDGWVD